MLTYSKTSKKDLDPNDHIKTLVTYTYTYIYFLTSEIEKHFTIYTVLIKVYYTLHTERNGVYGAPHSDRKPAQTYSSYQCVYYITTVQSSPVPLATMTSSYLINDGQSGLASLTHYTVFTESKV